MADILHAGDEVAHLAGAEPLAGFGCGRDDADFQQLVSGAGGHHAHGLTWLEPPVHDAHVGDHAAVGVIHGVEDEGAGGRVRSVFARRRGHELAHAVEKLLHAFASFAGDAQHILRFATNDGGDLLGVLVGVGGGEINLVEDGDDLQVVLHRHVEVGERLSLDALGSVDKQNSALAGLEGTGDLVGEVNVTGRINEVHDDFLARTSATARNPRQAHVLRLNGDAALALDIHVVQVLIAHVALLHHAGELQDAVRQGGFAVVNVRNNAEVADVFRVRKCVLCEISRHENPLTITRYSSEC